MTPVYRALSKFTNVYKTDKMFQNVLLVLKYSPDSNSEFIIVFPMPDYIRVPIFSLIGDFSIYTVIPP